MSAAAEKPVHYLDHAATTPILPAVVDELNRLLPVPGNAGSVHGSGRRARRLVEESRERLAAALGARPADVVFTGGGTEADNLAVKGLYWARQRRPRRRVLVTEVEHHAVLDAAEWLGTQQGAVMQHLPVDADGVVRLDAARAALDADPDGVAVLSCMWINNEVGTVQPLAAVVELAHARGVPVHTDAVQAIGQVPVDLGSLGADAVSITGHKIGGPVGVGALIVGPALEGAPRPVPLLHGGGQERGMRSGTADVAGIGAFALAVELAVERQHEQGARLHGLGRTLLDRLRASVPDVVLNGPALDGPAVGAPAVVGSDGGRSPAIWHLTFPGCDGDALLMLLDRVGVECSTGSACSAGVPQASHVLLAMGRNETAAAGSLRISLGHSSTLADVDAFVAAIGPAVARARAAGTTAVRRAG
jgi:cysteine desulfurase